MNYCTTYLVSYHAANLPKGLGRVFSSNIFPDISRVQNVPSDQFFGISLLKYNNNEYKGLQYVWKTKLEI